MGKKSKKQYRRLMAAYERFFGFHKPYQVLVDAAFVQDFSKRKDDLTKMLNITLQGDVKPMITQCSIRHLYALKEKAAQPPRSSKPISKKPASIAVTTAAAAAAATAEPGTSVPNAAAADAEKAIDLAKLLERRFCGHRPDEYPEPLDTLDCLRSVVDVHGRNKHRYVVATQDVAVRRALRDVVGVPLVYVEHGVTKLEPMAQASEEDQVREEKRKFREGIKSQMPRKRKDRDNEETAEGAEIDGMAEPPKKKKGKNYGRAKGPNPLSVMKGKKKPPTEAKKVQT